MSASKKHIVLLTSEFPPLPGGIGNHAYNLAELFQRNGFEVSVIADQRDTAKNEDEFDATLKSKVHRISKIKIRFLMYIKRIWLSLKLSKKADYLICSGKFPLWVGASLKLLVNAKTVAIIHGTEVNFTNPSLRKSINASLKRFDKIIAVSNFTKSLIDDLDLKNIEVIANGFSVSEIENEDQNNFKIKGNPKLLTVGNITERKGQLNVIKHLPNLIKVYPEIHYHCVGFKTEIDSCLDLAKHLKVDNHITFHGHVNHTQLQMFYKQSDICIMLSQTTKTGDIEGFGIALIEANHFRLPTIGAKNCGIEDAINNEKSGILIDKDNVDEFTTATATILNNKTKFEAGAKKWAEQHQWQHIIKKYITFIEV